MMEAVEIGPDLSEVLQFKFIIATNHESIAEPMNKNL